MTELFIRPLGTNPSLEQLGGKGNSLAGLVNAGFIVPDGFHITTSAYRRFLQENDLSGALAEAAAPDVVKGAISFEAAAARVQTLIEDAVMPMEVRQAITSAFEELAADRVAVRSSATAEDLPGLSFAGQQDTYLHIRGLDPLLEAVQRCWGSLWTARAMGYRHQMGISQSEIAMAVVVQTMVPAEVSGVLFTANPTTGARDEMIVNASYGLGEAIVSGEVTPDSYVIDRTSLEVKEAVIGAKEQMIVGSEDQGTVIRKVRDTDRLAESISREALEELTATALKIESHFGDLPQDIEWLIADGKLWLLQSRPITHLPPPPLTEVRWEPPEPSAYLGRSQLVEHIPDPVSTLFEDLHMKRSLQYFWGRNLTRRGQHDFVDTQPPASFHVQTTVNGYAYRHLGEPPRTGRAPDYRPRQWVPRALRPGLQRWQRRWMNFKMFNLWTPEWRFISLPRYRREVRRWEALVPSKATPNQLWAAIRKLSEAEARYWYHGGVWNAFSLTRGTESQLHNFLQENSAGRFSSGQFLSGLRSPAFDAHVALWRVANAIREDKALYKAAIATSPWHLLSMLAEHPSGERPRRLLDVYIKQYGHQIFTLDFVEPSEADDPDSIAQSLYALVLQADYDPLARQREVSKRRRDQELEAIGFFEGDTLREFRRLLRRARRYYPNREAAMFHMGRAWTVLRPLTMELGQRLADVGTLHAASDVFFLNLDELGRAIRALLAGDGLPEYRQLTVSRRSLREARRWLNPPTHVGNPPPWISRRVNQEDERNSDDQLKGSPVSPGTVTAPVSLILSPSEFSRMKPGSILVCPTTTPAWTQLFPQAVGLVTDIGGILAHGSIVAREYGIPAVLGVGDATRRIADGQIITVDGNRGLVTLAQVESNTGPLTQQDETTTAE
ncbi:MAG: PEP-utilizing enzyme [Proteobacteria bacterium]|nr:PEP-utilizing enzyme [Pseudomonadota bacterium]